MKTKYALVLISTTFALFLLSGFKSFAQDPFITVWKTDTTYLGTSGLTTNTQIQIPATGTFSYNWERVGTPAATGTGTGSGATTITFPSAGTYRVRITPTGTVANQFKRFAFTAASPSSDAIKLIGVEKWGDILWNNMDYAFSGTSNLTSIIATDTPNLSNVTSMREMFSYAVKLTSVAGINNWDVSTVTNMRAVFMEANAFNSNIGNWNVSNVTNMQDMFRSALVFNQNIAGWNVGNVTTMFSMFRTANAFNQNIGSWDVSSVTNMSYMFNSALIFNQNISFWDVNGVLTMDFMFQAARAFNQPIGTWDVSTVTNMNTMFMNADAFNQPLHNWNVAAVTNMQSMFQSADVFNQQLAPWNLNSVTNVTNMFNLTALSCSNYSNTLIGWAANANTPGGRSLTNNTLFTGGAIKYSTDGQTARNTLINTKGWIITGDSYDASCVTTPLQVKLSAFKAYKQNDQALLQWTTVSEQNNNGFEIQKSADGVKWEKTGFVYTEAVNGNSNTAITYNYIDERPFSGANYYRLKQIDVDGKFEYSDVVMLQFGSGANLVRIYPNPVRSVLNIENKGNNHIVIANALGQIILSKTTSDRSPVQTIDCTTWAKGMYFISITDDTGKQSVQKIIKE